MKVTRIEGDPVYWQPSSDEWWYSRERGVCLGTVRRIDGGLYVASAKYGRGLFRKPDVLWRPISINAGETQ